MGPNNKYNERETKRERKIKRSGSKKATERTNAYVGFPLLELQDTSQTINRILPTEVHASNKQKCLQVYRCQLYWKYRYTDKRLVN